MVQLSIDAFAAHVIGHLTLQEASVLVLRLYAKSNACPCGVDPTCLETIRQLDQAHADWYGVGLLFSIDNAELSAAIERLSCQNG